MKKLIALLALIMGGISVYSQTDSIPRKKKDWSKVSLGNRANDHLMLQFGYDAWSRKPDSINTTGFPHSMNGYIMLDFPFKTDPRFSVGIGAGVSGSNMYFDKMIIGIAGQGLKLDFKNVADTTHFKRYKLATTYLEAPLELRFASDPENNGKSFKFALGTKIGIMVNAHTKGKDLRSKGGTTLNEYTTKESSKRFFNGPRFAGTARVGYGVFSFFAVYQLNAFIKETAGPNIRPWSIGMGLSGL